MHDPDVLCRTVEMVGSDRVTLGSDYPFPLGEPEPGAMIESIPELDDEARTRILAGTALEFLGVRREDFAG